MLVSCSHWGIYKWEISEWIKKHAIPLSDVQYAYFCVGKGYWMLKSGKSIPAS